MGGLVQKGLIRGWGICNDNCYGLMASRMAAFKQGGAPPCVMQNDYSLLNRRVEENGLSEASSPLHENTGFMAYNALAGGVLTGKYLDRPASVDDPNPETRAASREAPRGRMDSPGWGRTLYRYRSGPAEDATRRYAKLAKANGMSLTELSLRWCRERAAVTTTLLGHTSLAQLEEDLGYFRQAKPLPPQLLWEVDRVHMRNRLPIFASTRVAARADACAPGPPLGTYGLRLPASRVGYVPEAQGAVPPGPRVLYVLGTHTSLGRSVRTAHRGTAGARGGHWERLPRRPASRRGNPNP